MAELEFNPLEPEIARGPRVGVGEAVGAGFESARLQGFRGESARVSEVYGPYGAIMDQVLQGYLDVPDDIRRSLLNDDFEPSEATLGQIRGWVEQDGLAWGYDVADFPDPSEVMGERERVYQRDAARINEQAETLSRAGSGTAVFGQIVGSVGAEFLDPVNLATLPMGAAARAGFLTTVAIEAAINAGVEVLQTEGRNEIARRLGQEETSALYNAAIGALFGGAVGGVTKGVELGLPEAGRIISRTFRRPADQRALAETLAQADEPEVAFVARQLLDDLDDQAAATGGGRQTIEALNEHERRVEAVTTALARGEAPDIPDRPIDAVPRASIISGEIEEIDPRDLVVDPSTFQFKSDADETGLTEKLRNVSEWRPERASVVLVYESADGVRFIADGHQRTGLANRIMQSDPSQEIRLAGKVFREIDGFTPEQVRVIAALKNIAEAADGMTTAMARDAAKVLRVDPAAIRDLPQGPGIARAQQLSRLSDDAFALVINQVIPDNMAALVGRLVEDPAMHMPIMRLLERTSPSTEAQADAIIRQALAAPVEREITEDLFGTTEQVESLYLERAKVLERAMKMLREDERTFRTLTERGDTIEGRAANTLDADGNAQQRRLIEQAMVAIQKLAYRAGPISEALDNGAQTYKGNGRLADAARAVAGTIQRQIERNGLSGAGVGATGRGAEPSGSRQSTPDPNEGFSDPIKGPDVDRQIASTRLDANERPAEGFASDEEARRDLGRRIAAGASREELDRHPAVVAALQQLEERAARATNLQEGYGSADWHQSRKYQFEGETVIGTEAMLGNWIRQAEAFAGDVVKRERRATIVLGPPAAGKSTIAEDLARAKGAAILDSDEIKQTMPEFDGGIGSAAVHEESSDLADLVEAALRQDGTNVVFPKVGGSPGSIRRAIERFKADGYTVELVNMAVTPENAYKRMLGRFVQKGRLIPPEFVDMTGDKPSGTYRTIKEEGLADGYAEIDNNGGFRDPKPITDRGGEINPLANSSLDLPEGGRAGDVRADREPDAGRDVEQTPEGFESLNGFVEVGASPVKSGFVRMYHGGNAGGSGGARWFTSSRENAEGWAMQRGGAGSDEVFYVDVPRSNRMFEADYVDQTVDQGVTVQKEFDPAEYGGANLFAARPSGASEVSPEGDQLLIDGVKPITARERVQTAADRPLLGPTRTSDNEIGGMFDSNDPSRFDLFDQVPVGRGVNDDNTGFSVTMSRQELAAELDADDEAVALLDICVRG